MTLREAIEASEARKRQVALGLAVNRAPERPTGMVSPEQLAQARWLRENPAVLPQGGQWWSALPGAISSAVLNAAGLDPRTGIDPMARIPGPIRGAQNLGALFGTGLMALGMAATAGGAGGAGAIRKVRLPAAPGAAEELNLVARMKKMSLERSPLRAEPWEQRAWIKGKHVIGLKGNNHGGTLLELGFSGDPHRLERVALRAGFRRKVIPGAYEVFELTPGAMRDLNPSIQADFARWGEKTVTIEDAKGQIHRFTKHQWDLANGTTPVAKTVPAELTAKTIPAGLRSRVSPPGQFPRGSEEQGYYVLSDGSRLHVEGHHASFSQTLADRLGVEYGKPVIPDELDLGAHQELMRRYRMIRGGRNGVYSAQDLTDTTTRRLIANDMKHVLKSNPSLGEFYVADESRGIDNVVYADLLEKHNFDLAGAMQESQARDTAEMFRRRNMEQQQKLQGGDIFSRARSIAAMEGTSGDPARVREIMDRLLTGG